MSQVEPLSTKETDAAVALLGLAFADHPMSPADPAGKPKGHSAGRMMGALLDAFDGATDLHWFAIPTHSLEGEGTASREGELACFAMVFEYGYEPPLRKMPGMMWRMIRLFGFRKAMTYGRLMNEKHPTKREGERRLELLILGTHPEHQSHGLGRAMLRHVYGWGQQRGYDAVLLEAAKHTPAYGFYEREGFVAEKEVALPEMPLVWMRRELGGSD